MGFVQATGDPCLYVALEGEIFLIAVYVHDILLAEKDDERMAAVKQAFSQEFQVKDMGELHHFLGMKVVQDQETGSVWIGQKLYLENILRSFGMENCKAIRTPVDACTKLMKVVDNDTDIYVDQKLYQSAVGSLLYVSLATRPDITFAVSNVAKFCAKPSKQHWIEVKRIFCYLKGTQHYGLLYKKGNSEVFQMLIGVVTLTNGNQPLVMFSRLKKQPSVGEARSRHAWLYQPPKLSTLLYQVLLRSYCDCSSFLLI